MVSSRGRPYQEEPMRVAVIENMRNTGLGALAAALDEAGAEIEWFRVWQDGILPLDISGHDALVVLGGEQSALDDETHPYLPELVRLTRRFGDAGKAVLGICLGSQILARAYGADNHLGIAREFGWHRIGVTADGRADPLLSALGGEFTIFEWHADTFSLPEGAVRLASSPVAENQAFRIGRAVYGTQFHFEANSDVVEQWKAEFPDTIARIAPGWLEKHAELAVRHGGAADAAGLAIARAWVSLIEREEVEMLSQASA
ncbi:type 1 glutamine amidotransferase [Rhizobium leguminosarum]|uniref:type 1 glutamine amidotransferase n=1 Tax=Rhizobium leguminosarum TaxID=384 RepID=UPI00293DE508|nr:type 1 glutamine amidotransferase [Rhizobium leguminosarum]MDV4161544.1 type 1 glutamine amidotransferase [Rhizobium leguminosarum]MDV4171680.1 type 1 glutamine amidotransferase [Rhizobium leguminosarum]